MSSEATPSYKNTKGAKTNKPPPPQQQRKNRNNNRNRNNKKPNISDEEALVCFTPYLRAGEPEAVHIHETYSNKNNNKAFLNSIKQYLTKQKLQDETITIIKRPQPAPPQPEPVVQHEKDEHGMDDMSSMVKAVTDLIDSDDDDNFPNHQLQDDAHTPIKPKQWKHTNSPVKIDHVFPQTPITKLELINKSETDTTPALKPYQKRLVRNQPGKILANNVPSSKVITLPPKCELTARWSLPLAYLRELVLKKSQNEDTSNITVRHALETLSVGLYRRGCSDNGTAYSIISKEVMSKNKDDSFHFAVDEKNDVVWGDVPFYTPRSPGNIVFRLYFENDVAVTLATGPTIIVDVQEEDLEPTLRFILSNFKSKKGSGLSSMYSLSITCENFRIPPSFHYNNNHQQRTNYEGAGRAAWGCICESRKIVMASEEEYLRRKEKIIVWEKELMEEKETLDVTATDENDEHLVKWKERMSAVMSEKAMIDRKWREVQVAYATILRAILSNHPCYLYIRRDLITKLRLEYELYCPLSECFASNPFESEQYSSLVETNTTTASTTIFPFPHPIHSQHFNICAKSRMEMQLQRLGFIPRFETVKSLLQHTKNSIFQKLTASMHTMYERDLSPNADFYRNREEIRTYIQNIVQQSFPSGTAVAIFGSSANGFGSSYSDLDLCLQLPSDTKKDEEDDSKVHDLLNQLAIDLEQSGMQSINTSRLTARIPIIMFHYPQQLTNSYIQGYDPEDSTTFVKCEISMQNSLALLNTSLLMTYSSIDPRVRVLASVIKLWAKNRDINNPSCHTLSTYGYILMMLHFLIQFKSSSISAINNRQKNHEEVSVLPNLQWIDPFSQRQANKNARVCFTTLPYKPNDAKFLMKHPRMPDYTVNTYFCSPPDAQSMRMLQQHFTGNNRTSVGILLASFFRYYAYEFDYKKYVVSLNYSTTNNNPSRSMEKETKGETDGWKLHGAPMSIEDPFETFYDVAHVLKLSSFHRIRREFAMAYTKIVNVVFGNNSSSTFGIEGDDSMMNLCDSGEEIIRWICQEIDC